MIRILLAAAILATSIAPAFAQYRCYTYQGRMICCNTVGNFTNCT